MYQGTSIATLDRLVTVCRIRAAKMVGKKKRNETRTCVRKHVGRTSNRAQYYDRSRQSSSERAFQLQQASPTHRAAEISARASHPGPAPSLWAWVLCRWRWSCLRRGAWICPFAGISWKSPRKSSPTSAGERSPFDPDRERRIFNTKRCLIGRDWHW